MTDSAAKRVILLGATGSIGSSTLRVLRAHPDKLKLVGVAAHSNHSELAQICDEFDVPNAVLRNETAFNQATDFPKTTKLATGESALIDLVTQVDADIVLIAVVGACGLRPALAAIEAGKDIALANKELLVLGGQFVIEAAKRKQVRLLPTDSEHNAIFQCIEGHSTSHIERLILTASGGQFRDRPIDELQHVTPADATKHPNWSMGPKITVDSSTMANKGLELIEAYWLFGLPADRLEVVIHPQSIAHSFVQFEDGSILGQFSPPSMTFPIQHCLLYPNRFPGVDRSLDFKQTMRWDFSEPDLKRYPCLKLAYDSLSVGQTAPAIFNAANEIAVERFLAHELSYLEIPAVIDATLATIAPKPATSIDDLFEIDSLARDCARTIRR